MNITLSELAKKFNLNLVGEDKNITGLNTLEQANKAELSFLANPKYIQQLENTKAAAVIIHPDLANKVHNSTALLSQNPYLDFAQIMTLFANPQGTFKGISSQAFIHPEAEVEENCTIYPFVYIAENVVVKAGTTIFPGCYLGENTYIGKNCILYPNVVLMNFTCLGDNCIIHSGVVIGADGFGFVPTPMGIKKIPQLGTVTIADNVEIGANAAVDRATLGQTAIGNSSKIDNLVQIGHNVQVGSHCIIVAQAGIAGSTKLGNQVTLAAQSGISGHLSIEDGATVGPQAGVAHNIAKGNTVGGTPAIEKNAFLKTSVLMPKLPTLFKRVKQLETDLMSLKKMLAETSDV